MQRIQGCKEFKDAKNSRMQMSPANENPWLLFIAAENTERASLPRQIRSMYHAFKIHDGRTCGECAHLYRVINRGKIYFKCDLFGETRGAGTDWRKKWTACGKFVVMELKKG